MVQATRPLPASAKPSFSEALADVANAQKTAKGGPAYSIYVNRRFGRVLAAAAFVLGRTPNQVTAVSATCSYLAIALIAVGDPSFVLGATITALLVAGHALDAADGQLARLRGGGCPSGEWLDHMIDAVKIVTLHAAVLIHLHRTGDLGDGFLLVPLAYTAVAATLFFAQLLNEQLRRSRNSEPEIRPAGSEQLSIRAALLKLPHDYGMLCWAFVLLGSTSVFFGVYAFLFAFNGAYLALALVKWFGDMRGLDAEAAR